MASSPSDSEVTDSSSSTSEKSLSEEDSEAVDGAYSCFSGDEDRRCFFKNSGVKEGIDTGLGAVLFARAVGRGVEAVTGRFLLSSLLDNLDGAEPGSSGLCCDLDLAGESKSKSSAFGELDFLTFGIVGMSDEGTEDVLRWIVGLC